MQSSHIRTVDICFLACKASSFWSIFQENSEKRVFWSSPYCCFCLSRPMVGCIFIAMLLILSVTPYDWLCVVFHVYAVDDWMFWLSLEQKAEQARDSHFSAFIYLSVIRELKKGLCIHANTSGSNSPTDPKLDSLSRNRMPLPGHSCLL